jgi:predicted RNase H-like HicB family nuclease
MVLRIYGCCDRGGGGGGRGWRAAAVKRAGCGADIMGKTVKLLVQFNIHAVIHGEDGDWWAEVPAIPGCASQGATLDELLANLDKAIKGCLGLEAKD